MTRQIRLLPRRWLVAASVVPVVVATGVLSHHAAPGAWLAVPPGTLAALAADLLLLNSAALVLGAPLAGVALACSAEHFDRTALQPRVGNAQTRTLLTLTQLVIGVAGFVAVSGLLVWGGLGASADALRTAVRTHGVLMAAGLALGTLGLLLGSIFRDPLDGAACGSAVSAAIGAGAVAVGPLLSEAPTWLVNAALVSSPLIATAAAGHIDILRTEVLYQLSPIAHMRFDYPEWYVVVPVYLLFALACLAGALWSATVLGRRIDS